MQLRTNPWRMCAIIGVSLAGALASPAIADHTSRGPTHTHRAAATSIGCLTIGGTRYDFVDCCDLQMQIVDAFQCAGYDARLRGSRVYVEIGRCAPLVRFSGFKHRVSVSRRGNHLVLRPFRISSYRSRRLPYIPSYRQRGHYNAGQRIGCSDVVEFRSSRGRCR